MARRLSSSWSAGVGALGLLLGFPLSMGGCEATESGSEPVSLAEAEARVQQSLCRRVFSSSCRCEQWRWFDSLEECEEEVSLLMSAIDEVLADYPSTRFDEACMGDYIYLLDSIGCASTYDGIDECQRPCLLVHGDRREGESCEIYGELISDCAQGLVCYGTCTNPCGTEGGESFAGLGESCQMRPCADDLLCDFSGDQVCVARPSVGELCVDGQCQEGAFCDPSDPNDPMSEQRCFSPRDLDEPCRGHMQCQSGYCPAGFCSVAPREGETCEAGVCALGLACIEEICGPGDAILCTVGLPGF